MYNKCFVFVFFLSLQFGHWETGILFEAHPSNFGKKNIQKQFCSFCCGSIFFKCFVMLLVTSFWQTVLQGQGPPGKPGACWRQNLPHLSLEFSFAPSIEAGEKGLCFSQGYTFQIYGWKLADGDSQSSEWWTWSTHWSVTILLICTAVNSFKIEPNRCNLKLFLVIGGAKEPCRQQCQKPKVSDSNNWSEVQDWLIRPKQQ